MAKRLMATHKGFFTQEFGKDVDCYVLDDEAKTAVISQRGMGIAIGLHDSGGSQFPRFIQGKRLSNYIGLELRKKLDNPIVFQSFKAGPGTNTSNLYGYDVTILIDLCESILEMEAEDEVHKYQKHIAKQAHVIVNASSKLGIQQLVYALSGYQEKRQEKRKYDI